MKQIFMALALLCGVNLTACAQKQKTQPMTHDVKILVAYFSATGTVHGSRSMVDEAPTMAAMLGLTMPDVDGAPIFEILR